MPPKKSFSQQTLFACGETVLSSFFQPGVVLILNEIPAWPFFGKPFFGTRQYCNDDSTKLQMFQHQLSVNPGEETSTKLPSFNADSVISYDRAFRQLAEKDPGLPWDRRDIDLYTRMFTGQALRPPLELSCGNSSNRLNPRYVKTADGDVICRNYNLQRCQIADCRFAHCCFLCRGPQLRGRRLLYRRFLVTHLTIVSVQHILGADLACSLLLSLALQMANARAPQPQVHPLRTFSAVHSDIFYPCLLSLSLPLSLSLSLLPLICLPLVLHDLAHSFSLFSLHIALKVLATYHCLILGGWLAREALLLHVHVAYGSCLLLRTHVAYGPLLLRTRVAYGICLAIAYPCCIRAFAVAYPCCIWDCDPQRHTSPPCRHASLSCHLCLTACCYSRGIGLNVTLL